MQQNPVRNKIQSQIQHMVNSAIILNRRFLDDEQLIRSEQMAVLEDVFNNYSSDELAILSIDVWIVSGETAQDVKPAGEGE